ncbi:hypothetical protein ACIBF5_02190 [Micromonospora sp. NPDC050417]|uniref:hypothetical protein n=1 Tax=Micromonospora sp. NPDC050417 TaxID=3364280 RepID=UPI0037B70BA0
MTKSRRTFSAFICITTPATFLAVAVIALSVGLSGLTQGSTFASKMMGAFFVGTGIALLTGAIASSATLPRSIRLGELTAQQIALSGSAHRQLAILSGFCATTVTGVLVLAQTISGDLDARVWVALFLFISSTVALAVIIACLKPSSLLPRKLAAGAAISSLLAIGNFTYSSIYLPYAEEPLVSVSPTFGAVSPHPTGDDLMLPLSVEFKFGRTEAVIMVATYIVLGRRAKVTEHKRTLNELRLDLYQGRDASTRTSVADFEFIQGGYLLGSQSRYSRGLTTRVDRIVLLPTPVEYDSIELRTTVSYMRADRAFIVDPDSEVPTRGGQRPPDWTDIPETPYYKNSHWRLVERNALNSLVRDPVWVSHWWVLGAEGGPPDPTEYLVLTRRKPTDRSSKDFDGDPFTTESKESEFWKRYGASVDRSRITLLASAFPLTPR